MKVVPRRYGYCMECETDTVQWLVDAPIPQRGAWGRRKPPEYRCQECGCDNYGR